MFVTAIIAAGGRGARLGGEPFKQLRLVGGRPILELSVGAFVGHPLVSEVIVALPRELAVQPPSYLRSAKHVRIVARGLPERIRHRILPARESQVIVIHDAARPFVSANLISRTIDAAALCGAALAASPSRDTVKRVASREATGSLMVAETLRRETIYLAQTPQAFRRDVLSLALEAGERGLEATDEAALAERAGQPVQIVEGESSNIKITTPDDLIVAEAIAAARDEPGPKPVRTGRAGTGYDLHRLVAGRPLVLGGVTIPSPRGAEGHSDADVVCHAVTDAILGAACLGDIGRHFPDTDPRWKDASSLDLLARAVAMVAEHGFEIGNVDVTVILEAPKVQPHVERMRAAVAAALGVDLARVSIKGKTNEGLDAIGRGEAIAAHAVALVRAQS